MLTPHFGHPHGLLLKIVAALVMRLVRQRGQRNPQPNTAKTETSSNDMTLIRNVWLYPVSRQDKPTAPTSIMPTHRNLYQPANARLIVILRNPTDYAA
jgi:hypothetical protein